ncbi:unnamed protein product, partial [Thlaspi arvense]
RLLVNNNKVTKVNPSSLQTYVCLFFLFDSEILCVSEFPRSGNPKNLCEPSSLGITTLEDENELRGAEPDPSVVDQTIGESKVVVVLISEKYASSPLCLRSLVRILGFYHSGSLHVIPVFYDIEPCDVRKQSGKLWEPFSLHEREHPANVQTWRQTLSQLADIPTCQFGAHVASARVRLQVTSMKRSRTILISMSGKIFFNYVLEMILASTTITEI